MNKLVIICALALVGAAQPALAVEKTAIDRRTNTAVDVQVETLRAFVTALQSRVEQDLGDRLTRLTTTLTTYDDLVPQLEERIELLTTARNDTACAHAQVNVPTPCDPTRQRLRWTGVTWSCVPLEPWELRS